MLLLKGRMTAIVPLRDRHTFQGPRSQRVKAGIVFHNGMEDVIEMYSSHSACCECTCSVDQSSFSSNIAMEATFDIYTYYPLTKFL